MLKIFKIESRWWITARYLQNKDKFLKYRVVAEVNQATNDFPRDKHGNLDDSFDDLYIRCSNGNRIYNYGRGVLVAYILSIGRGNNILKALDENIAFDIEKTDEEILFKFKYKDLDQVAALLKAHNSPKGRDGNYHYISAFSTKNLPKNKVKIPEDKLHRYTELTTDLGQNNPFMISVINNEFLNSLTNKKKTFEDIKADMKLKGLKGKDYIYEIGKFDEYLEFIEKRIRETN